MSKQVEGKFRASKRATFQKHVASPRRVDLMSRGWGQIYAVLWVDPRPPESPEEVGLAYVVADFGEIRTTPGLWKVDPVLLSRLAGGTSDSLMLDLGDGGAQAMWLDESTRIDLGTPSDSRDWWQLNGDRLKPMSTRKCFPLVSTDLEWFDNGRGVLLVDNDAAKVDGYPTVLLVPMAESAFGSVAALMDRLSKIYDPEAVAELETTCNLETARFDAPAKKSGDTTKKKQPRKEKAIMTNQPEFNIPETSTTQVETATPLANPPAELLNGGALSLVVPPAAVSGEAVVETDSKRCSMCGMEGRRMQSLPVGSLYRLNGSPSPEQVMKEGVIFKCVACLHEWFREEGLSGGKLETGSEAPVDMTVVAESDPPGMSAIEGSAPRAARQPDEIDDAVAACNIDVLKQLYDAVDNDVRPLLRKQARIFAGLVKVAKAIDKAAAKERTEQAKAFEAAVAAQVAVEVSAKVAKEREAIMARLKASL